MAGSWQVLATHKETVFAVCMDYPLWLIQVAHDLGQEKGHYFLNEVVFEARCNHSHSITDVKVVSKSPKNALPLFKTLILLYLLTSSNMSSFHPPGPLKL